ncbi:MAG: alpha/beta fold hydrolase [Pseudoxanthomonas sp.]
MNTEGSGSFKPTCSAIGRQLSVTRAFTCRCLACLLALTVCGCNTVTLKETSLQEYIHGRQSDVLGTGDWSTGARQAFVVAGLPGKACDKNVRQCLHTIAGSQALDDEMRLSALSELWLKQAIALSPHGASDNVPDAALDAYLESARAAYAYLFFSGRDSGERAFDIRQAQVVEFYNYAARRAISTFFNGYLTGMKEWRYERAGWSWLRPDSDVRFGDTITLPSELIPADELTFKGLRNTYRRDGLGATFVAAAPGSIPLADHPWREPEYVPLTGLLVFPGNSLDEVMGAKQVEVLGRDPAEDVTVQLNDRTVPFSADYTAPYGVWLSRSGFNRQSLLNLFGRGNALTEPRILMMRPFDPGKRTIVMIHGLASSPEAWINVANALLGYDRQLRSEYQIWQVYYPTNLPIAVNRAKIHDALEKTITHFDPDRSTRATRDMVLIGHSMGGVIARLLVSASQDRLWDSVPIRDDFPAEKKRELREELRPYLVFEPMPEVTRAIFLAAPHRGSPKASMTIARLVRRLIQLPADVVHQNATLIESLKAAAPLGYPTRPPNSIDYLSEKNRFITAAATLPISSNVHYHSIIGRYKDDDLPLADSSDSVVPYRSAHLPGAESQLIVSSRHDVQDKVEAMLEIRRILRLHLDSISAEENLMRTGQTGN